MKQVVANSYLYATFYGVKQMSIETKKEMHSELVEEQMNL